MKWVIFSGFSVLLLCAIVPAVQAQTIAVPSTNAESTTARVTPFDLVSLAYQESNDATERLFSMSGWP